MAQSVIGALRVNLGLDSAQFERGARRTRDPLRQMRSQFLAVSAAAAAMGTALSLAVRSGLQDVDRVAKAARTIDGTTGALRALELAAGDAGVSQSDVTNAAQRMTREIARAAREGGRGADALGRLGLEASALADMDADERMATIADRIRELGLSSGDTMDLLRDLGVRSEEMALLMTQGGGAIRAARREVDDLGLALDDQAVRQIERTNDSLSRIGLAFQAFRNRLAASVAPALEALSDAFVDSMREGGALRRVLDGLSDNLQRIITYVGTAVTFFGARYVAALVAARIATMSLSGALVALRGALIRTGIGALIVGAGEMVFWFGRLARATGSWGEALSLLANVAVGVFNGIIESGKAIPPALGAVWEAVKSSFINAVADMAESWQGFLMNVAAVTDVVAVGPFAGFAGLGDAARGAAAGVNELRESAKRASSTSRDLTRIAGQETRAAFDEARTAMDAVRDALGRMGDGEDDIDDVTDAADRLNEALSNIGDPGGGGGGSAGAATDGMDRFRDSIADTRSTMSEFENASRQAFVGFVSGADSARQAASRLLDSFARILANQAFTGLFGGLFGGGSPMSFTGGLGPGTLPVPSFAGGGFTGNGPRTGGVDGLGGFPAILHPGETVRDHRKGGGQDGMLIVELRGDIDARIAQGAENVVIRRKPQIVNESVGAAVEMNREKRVFE